MTDCLSPQLAMRPFSRRLAARPAAWPGLAVPAGHSFEPPLRLAPALLGFEPQLRPKALKQGRRWSYLADSKGILL